jgi:hypothetical protein
MILEWVGWGLAWRVGDVVYVFRGLRKSPGLLRRIVKHEAGHLPGRWRLGDLRYDMESPVDWEGIMFMLRHPRTWVQLSPFIRLGGKWFFERSVAVIWLLAFFIVLFCVVYWFGVQRGIF